MEIGSEHTYRGGRFVFGVGSSCPHDFRFFVGFCSFPSSSSLILQGDSGGELGVNRLASAKEMVAWGG